jgi:ankyrin repeat protein
MLLERKFDPSQAMNDGRTPLHLAIDGHAAYPGAQEDAGEKVRLLLASGAAPDAVDKQGRAPLFHAVETMNRDFTLRLIEKGASVDRLTKDGLTPLIVAARSFHDHFVSPEKYAAIVAALAARTTAVDARDSSGMTALMWAAASDVPAAVEVLLARHADLNARGKDGRTALMWAASANAGQTIKVLLEKGADKSVKDNAGRTASAWARWLGQGHALDLLGDEAP